MKDLLLSTRNIIVWSFICGLIVVLVNTLAMRADTDPFTVKRVLELRGAGFSVDGIHTLSGIVKVTKDDYFLMGADNATAARNHPNVPREELTEGRWWTAAPGLKEGDVNTFNFHGVQGKDGEWYLESFYSDIVKPQYAADPQEVVWHATRVQQLRKQGVERNERVRIIQVEALTKPWRNPQPQEGACENL